MPTIKSLYLPKKVVSREMESSPTTLLQYHPFPRHSVNIVVGPTHIGKTFFVKKLLSNYKVYFSGPVGRILVILCNDRVQPLTFTPELDVEVEQIPLSEFEPYSLEQNDLVVIDDLATVTAPIRDTLIVGAHHYNLASLFVITHDLLGSANFELIRKAQRIFFFMSASTNTRTVKYIINEFYHDTEIKDYLKSVATYCQREKEVLALELSPITTSETQNFHVVLAFSHLTWLVDRGFFLVYPFPYWGKNYTANFSNMASVVEKIDSFPYDEMPEHAPNPTLVAVPMSAVIEAKQVSETTSKSVKCSEKQQWEDTIQEIEDNIESYFPPPKWQKIKNLAKEILRNSQFCVKTDGKTFHLRDRPRTEVSMIDFLAIATRRVGPMERQRDPTWNVYALHVDTLLRNNAPKDLFKNKLLVPKRFQ
jgi:hypothetical protein